MEKMKSKILLFGFILTLLFGTIAGVYLLRGKTTPPPAPNLYREPTGSLPVGRQDAATADWKTYTNTKLGFVLKYPPQLSKKYSSSDDLTILVTQDFLEETKPQYQGKILSGSFITIHLL